MPAWPFEAGWSTSTQPCSGRVSGRAPQFTLGDEMGLRSDHQTGTLRFQVFEGSFTTEVFLAFLRRLVRSVPRKVFLVVDRHPVHRAHQVQQWVA